MAEIEVKATKGEVEKSLMYDFGDDLDDAVAKFGKETVFSAYVAQSKISLQALMRTRIEKGLPLEDLKTSWKPGVRLAAPAVDPLTAAKALFAGMDEAARAAFLQSLQESAEG